MNWLSSHKFFAHTMAFLLMIFPPIPMYFAMRGGEIWLVWSFLALVITGNLLAFFTR